MCDIDDQYVKQLFMECDNPVSKYKTLSEDIKKYVRERYDDSINEHESLWRILYNIHEKPVCPICGRPRKYHVKGKYRDTCGNKSCICKLNGIHVSQSMSSPDTQRKKVQKFKQTCMAKYGVDNVSKLNSVIEKIKDTKKERHGSINYNNREKFVITCIDRYGVDHYNKTVEQRHKLSVSISAAQEKTRQTCMNRYGVDSVGKIDEFKNKRYDTCIKRYGCKYLLQNETLKSKRVSTLKKNNSYMKSRLEDDCYYILCDKFGSNDIIRQYKSDSYPFNCDFYIISIDTYIEIQGNWTHGFHPFDKDNKNDIARLNAWKVIGTPYYMQAAYVWTDLDVRKRNIAKKNKLNFIEIYNIEDFNKWIMTV